jgi:hypothetical protein
VAKIVTILIVSFTNAIWKKMEKNYVKTKVGGLLNTNKIAKISEILLVFI